jgi:uncharacterized protein
MSLECPKCHNVMHQYERNGVTVDQCSECRGLFLDRGELERLVSAESNWYGPARSHDRRPHEPRYESRHEPRYESRHEPRYESRYESRYERHDDDHNRHDDDHNRYDDDHHRYPKKDRRRSFLEDLFG